VERTPIGVAALDRLYLIDEEGTFLDEIGPRYRDLALPVVRGIADEKGRVLPGRRELAGKVLAMLAEDGRLESTVSEIDVSEGADSLRITLRRPALTILAAEGNLVRRLTEIIPLAEEILQRYPSLEAVDVRFRGRAYLQLPLQTPEASGGADRPGESEGR
jgi:hypothetical protein